MADAAHTTRRNDYFGPRQDWRFRFRTAFDWLFRYGVAFGGISIIITILLIFFYFLYVVFPIFLPAKVEKLAEYSAPGGTESASLHLALEEQNEVGLRITAKGNLVFFRAASGKLIETHRPDIPLDTRVTRVTNADPADATVALGLINGKIIVLQHRYKISFPNNQRMITPQVVYPLGDRPLSLLKADQTLDTFAIQNNPKANTLAIATKERRLVLVTFEKMQSFLSEQVEHQKLTTEIEYPDHRITHLQIDHDAQELYAATDAGNIVYYDITDPRNPFKKETVKATTESSGAITSIESLAGGISVLVGTASGEISQWFSVRDDASRHRLKKIRSFDAHSAPITTIVPEYNRKGFLATDSQGWLGIYYTTSHNTILREKLGFSQFEELAISPRASAMLIATNNNTVQFWSIENEHPEISWSSLWGQVHYESYDEPRFIWQSSSASDTFEPKFSLVPISFGTIKAAFYAMMIAIPLALMGAIYTSQFMSRHMRRAVKPSIEIMEALPTVILGFLAGLWLAPLIEQNLPAVIALLMLLPPGVLIAGYIWHRVPERIRLLMPEGWEAAMLIPAVALIGWLAFFISPTLEFWLFNGDMPTWLNNHGIDFDQRNSIVVGVAMGFAVIPTIFSIAEDALFAVPRHLIHGSLALGATRWQTLTNVILHTASPGMFSAIMIGFGRAVGETMIVLMATGNTPIMDINIFEGMRTLSANIAVEMPESEVNSTHYRVLFLAALVLFVFTFIFNTVAEVVRQRLRRRYSTL